MQSGELWPLIPSDEQTCRMTGLGGVLPGASDLKLDLCAWPQLEPAGVRRPRQAAALGGKHAQPENRHRTSKTAVMASGARRVFRVMIGQRSLRTDTVRRR